MKRVLDIFVFKLVLFSRPCSPCFPRLTLNGPATQDGFGCTMTVACSVQVTGTGLASTNQVLVQGSTTQCDGHGRPLATVACMKFQAVVFPAKSSS